ncbi:UDP-N-acetylmuramoylalanyl-D-glutamyl-2,6-diaminopimelate--D-alanyl-D-alanine ligase [Lentilitoribacter sp. Alg239-R112]|uniref:UDP-N-acetylmuramoylalanyl-D-glutamyl-2, 6-diaminopimelate--D-alanyl-D-alanine ligase n=1 Tax=Lentilitoribacter sp. Alg239-R112 TaxID=2305987 RepID=UPI0013A6AF47|nr:UDP-N-acetylmuramoylalanyl-D-glutamyl-2,6-diaminopimelate--D-alanyl-D-alanine ligase [Lentilitoribacter sp. Alg239-R112]
MDLLWTISDMISVMHGRAHGNMPEGITGISIDSRNMDQGGAFFAIKGDRFDGHEFVTSALANGAGVLVVAEEKIPSLVSLTAPMIIVEDVLVAMEALGRAARARVAGKVIAITGSVGKTTAKEMLRTALSPSGKVHASVASFNNHWGVPLTLARMPKDTDFGVFEVGMNHTGEIRTLIDMVQPHIALITTVEAAHMGNFNDITEIADAKSEIMEGVISEGSVVLNRDNDQYDHLLERAEELGMAQNSKSFGQDERSDFRLISCKSHSDCSCFSMIIDGEEAAVKLGAPGDHLVQNALGVLGVCSLVGADMARAALALADFSAEKGRGARTQCSIGDGTFTLIDESYNANPASMRAAISLLSSTDVGRGGRRIAVLGDMLEMGRFSEALHAELAEPLYDAQVDIVALSGQDMSHLADVLRGEIQVYYRSEIKAIIDWLVTKLRPGDVVMVKSSLGVGFGKIVKKLLEQFPESNEQE